MKFKQMLCFVLACALLLAAGPVARAEGNAYVAPFQDVPLNVYYADAVAWAIENKITAGTADDKFSPELGCTRAQIVTFFWRLSGAPEPMGTSLAFGDVHSKSFYYKAVLWALEHGLTTGTSENTFSPDLPCTRAQAMTFLWRFAGKPMSSAAETSFKDIQKGSFYYDAVLWAVENGITTGVGTNKFAPDQTCVRAQIVTFLFRHQQLQAQELVYGTASLTYAEFYAGDVTSTESYDAVSSATNSKYAIFQNAYTDFVDAEANAKGYRVLGVQNVNVAIAAADVEAYKAINPTFAPLEEAPAQYKPVSIRDGKAVYSATKYHVEEQITDATAEVKYGTNWGDYEIDVTDPEGKSILRNGREDDFPVNSSIQGIILETTSGLKVGLEYLQSIWIQPGKMSFNVSKDNSHNTRISQWDNLPELDKLEGESVAKITFIMPNGVYVYIFDSKNSVYLGGKTHEQKAISKARFRLKIAASSAFHRRNHALLRYGADPCHHPGTTELDAA